eukprot:10993397-Lingulodinium_polyedra.AAC.1
MPRSWALLSDGTCSSLGARFERSVPEACVPQTEDSEDTPLNDFLDILVEHGYAAQTLTLDCSVWACVSRPRLYVVACSEAIGGSSG